MAEKASKHRDKKGNVPTAPGKAVTSDDRIIPGFGVTRKQLIEALKARIEGEGLRPLVAKELYDVEDLSLVTETHGSMIVPKVRMRILLAAMDKDREKPLLQVFLESYNKEMVSYERQGRLEYLGALQALASAAEGEEGVISLRR